MTTQTMNTRTPMRPEPRTNAPHTNANKILGFSPRDLRRLVAEMIG